MNHSLSLHNEFSFSHQLDVPFISRFYVIVTFSIATQIPRIHNFNRFVGKTFQVPHADGLMLFTTELSVTHLLAAFLRLASCPISYGRSFLASTHNVSNVVRGRNLLLRHSVKHYETRFVMFIPFCDYEQLMFHPILNLDIRHVLKVLEVVCHNRQPFADGMPSYYCIELVDRLAYLPKSVFDASIMLTFGFK